MRIKRSFKVVMGPRTRSDFLIIIEEYVGANKNALVDHKKDKNIKKHKKDIRT